MSKYMNQMLILLKGINRQSAASGHILVSGDNRVTSPLQMGEMS